MKSCCEKEGGERSLPSLLEDEFKNLVLTRIGCPLCKQRSGFDALNNSFMSVCKICGMRMHLKNVEGKWILSLTSGK